MTNKGTLVCPRDDPAYFKPPCDQNACDDEFECIKTGTFSNTAGSTCAKQHLNPTSHFCVSSIISFLIPTATNIRPERAFSGSGCDRPKGNEVRTTLIVDFPKEEGGVLIRKCALLAYGCGLACAIARAIIAPVAFVGNSVCTYETLYICFFQDLTL